MQLKALKLTGFKSFVDPTVIPFPSSLVAVVGPNGCGKSNIIDAVRWVMGESSAKSLRGEAMTDVIFNGSSQRKPLGQATVELVFDNSLGRLGGPYGAYSELSIKRLVTRDGDATYFLNGTKCRKRDIVDIFLGTGAGTRGYSIIGQGSISQIIEAKPEDLRAYFEEAAGISKYRERKRETLTKISHTRDNLLRVNDVREELSKTLSRLERQAYNAKRYQALKAEEKSCRLSILTLKQQALELELQAKQTIIDELKLSQVSLETDAVRLQKEVIEKKEQLHRQQASLDLMQQQCFLVATEVSKLEQTIAEKAREKQRLAQSIETVKGDWLQLSQQIDEDKAKLESLLVSIDKEEACLKEKQMTYTNAQEELKTHESAMTLCQQDFEKAQTEYFTHKRELELNDMQKAQLQREIAKLDERYEKLVMQVSHLNIVNLQQAQATNETHYLTAQTQLSQQEAVYQESLQTLSDKKEALKTLIAEKNETQATLLSLKSELTTLEARQKAAISITETNAIPHDYHPLIQSLTVDSEWQNICEWVLAEGVSAYVVNSLTALTEQSALFSQKGAYTKWIARRPQRLPIARLCDKIAGELPDWLVRLDSIYTVNTWQEAFQLKSQLEAHESVISLDGYWVGSGFLKILGVKEDKEAGLLGRQARIKALTQTHASTELQLDALSKEEQALNELIAEKEVLRDEAYQALTLIKETFLTAKNQQLALETQLSFETSQLETNQAELDAIVSEKQSLAETLYTLESNSCAQAERQVLSLSVFEQKSLEKERLQTELQQVKQQVAVQQETCFAQEKMVAGLTSQSQQIKHSVMRDDARLTDLMVRLEQLQEIGLTLESPDDEFSALLSEKVSAHRMLETSLSDEKQRLQVLQEAVIEGESEGVKKVTAVKTLQEKLMTLQLEAQTLVVKVEGLQENMIEMGGALQSELTLSQEEARLTELLEKIHRLGAINLAAIDEYDKEFTRKSLLDAQYDDLTESLATLEEAIAEMDKETKIRLQTTFDEVNLKFKQLFPRLFGGGQAMLTLTSDNLLEAGIQIMAQPPGKKNASIYLLSGGEKALTAIALVFAIFQLNPSPFCMLDEVDAPLDDVNVGRFCDLVKEMSQCVQFLVISHNKVTMEMASQLIGVTMREPGVSRVVSVDVEQALSMCES